ncbi:hypothetical protein BGZ82_005578, partial [Podila clonocystis]
MDPMGTLNTGAAIMEGQSSLMARAILRLTIVGLSLTTSTWLQSMVLTSTLRAVPLLLPQSSTCSSTSTRAMIAPL